MTKDVARQVERSEKAQDVALIVVGGVVFLVLAVWVVFGARMIGARETVDDFRVENGHRWEDVRRVVNRGEVAGNYVNFNQENPRSALRLLEDGTYSFGVERNGASSVEDRETGKWALRLGDPPATVAIVLEPDSSVNDSKSSGCGGNWLDVEECELGMRLRIWNDQDSNWYYTRRTR